jgi:hypothetical protein
VCVCTCACVFGYVRPNIMKKTLQEIYKTPLYVTTNVWIKPNWQKLIELANENANNDSEKYYFRMLFYGNPITSFTCSYQNIIQVKSISVNNKKLRLI